MKIKSFAIFLSGIALSAGAVFSGGLIASSMTINQTKASVQSGWARVTSVSDITSGGTFIIGYEATANSDVIVPMRNDGFSAAVTSNGYVYSGATVGSSTSVTINMGSVADTSLYEVAITASSTTTGAINIALANGYFIGNNNAKNTSHLYQTATVNADYTPTIGNGDVVTLTSPASVAATYPYLQYNTGNPRFCNYNGSQKHVVMYKEGTTAVLSSLAVSGTLAKTTYYVGDSFEVQGLTITATYDDLSTKDVTSECTFSPSVLTEGLTSVTATYVEGEVTKTAVIEGITVSTRNVVSISVLTNPTKMSYTIGQSFDPAGMIIRATYSAGPTNDNYSAYSYAPTAAFDSLGTKVITITSTENASISTTLSVEVAEAVITEGTYTITTVDTNYFDPAGVVATLLPKLNIAKSDVQQDDLTIVSIADFRLSSSKTGIENAGTLTLGSNDTTGGTMVIQLPDDIYATEVKFNGVQVSASTTFKVNEAIVDAVDGTATVSARVYANQITISSKTTNTRIWFSSFEIVTKTAANSSLDYGTHFLACTSGECLAGNVSSATWTNLQSIYANADTSIQDLIEAATANQSGTDLEHAIARYAVIVEKYGYTDFLALGYSSVGNVHFNNGSSNAIFMVLICGTALLAGVSFVYFFAKKKKHN